MRPKIIGVAAPARHCGKTEVATTLAILAGFRLQKFAEPIYSMFKALCGTAQMPEEQIHEACYGNLKDVPLAVLGGLSFRTFAEGVGTQWGRKQFDENLWVWMARARFAKLLDRGTPIVVDDVRFENEAKVIKDLGGIMINVDRPGKEPSLPSEGHLGTFDFDVSIVNDGTVEDLQKVVREWWCGLA